MTRAPTCFCRWRRGTRWCAQIFDSTSTVHLIFLLGGCRWWRKLSQQTLSEMRWLESLEMTGRIGSAPQPELARAYIGKNQTLSAAAAEMMVHINREKNRHHRVSALYHRQDTPNNRYFQLYVTGIWILINVRFGGHLMSCVFVTILASHLFPSIVLSLFW